MKELRRSLALFEQAQRYLPGGVNSPVRAFKAVGGNPPFIKYGKGSRIYDEDGNEYIDYVGSWGPLILGHAPPRVVRAIKKATERGASFGAPHELETVLAKMVTTALPSMEMVRFVNSGTEATMSAIRLARAATRRDKIVKFAGCYHGHSDGLLTKAGSGVMTLGIPGSPGVPAAGTSNTLVADYNDRQGIEQLFTSMGQEIAAVIVEPVAANMGVIPPQPGFLEHLRHLTQRNGALLIFDEVITGFRVTNGGAQALYNVIPDLTCLGKIIGGGLPVGAYGGHRQLMELVAPAGSVYQAGTLSGNPVVMAAGIETLSQLNKAEIYRQLEARSSLLEKGIRNAAKKTGINIRISRVGSILTVFFAKEPVTDYASASRADTKLYARFFHEMLSRGIYLPPSQFEAWFVSTAHTTTDIRATITAVEAAFGSLR